jgi:hypothetical protein
MVIRVRHGVMVRQQFGSLSARLSASEGGDAAQDIALSASAPHHIPIILTSSVSKVRQSAASTSSAASSASSASRASRSSASAAYPYTGVEA